MTFDDSEGPPESEGPGPLGKGPGTPRATDNDQKHHQPSDLAQAAQTATGSEAFALTFAQNIQQHRDKKRSARWAATEIIKSALDNGVDCSTVIADRELSELLESTFSEKGLDISTVWADQERERATAERKTRFLAEVAPKLNNESLALHMFEVVWLAERTPVEGVRHTVASSLDSLFQRIADLTEDERTVALALVDDTHLGTCLVPFGGIPQAWTDFQRKRAAQERQKVLDRLDEGYGPNAFGVGDKVGDAATLLGDAQGPPPAIWGSGQDVFWVESEALLIGAGVGAGKTTLAGLLSRALLFGGDVLGQPVKRLAPGQRVLYLALDRPSQIVRSLARQFTSEQRDALAGRLVIHRGALPADAAENPDVLKDAADYYGAHVVIVDSLKDAARGLVEDRVGAAYNDARRRLLGSGRELVELHHLTKGGEDYGSVWLNAGAGSVLRLSGKSGAKTTTLIHTKAPAHPVGPLKVIHDRDNGEASLRSTAPTTETPAAPANGGRGLVEWVTSRGSDGVSAADAAEFLYGSTERGDLERAKRALDKHTGPECDLFCIAGTRGGNDASRKPSRWVAVEEL
jgi:AAA domain